MTSAVVTKQDVANDARAAFARALITGRGVSVDGLAKWMIARQELADNGIASKEPLIALENTVQLFLENCSNLRPQQDKGDKATLLIDKDGDPLDIRQLSDGERGILALVLDLSKRLAQSGASEAIVLIDELDLHLHPRWQRDVVDRLISAFPDCQFIATTHSPHIISEVSPDCLNLIEREGNSVIAKKVPQSYGLDVEEILGVLMNTSARPDDVQKLIDDAEKAIENDDLENARIIVGKLQNIIHGGSINTARLEATINNIEALAYEEADVEDNADD